MIPCTGCIYDGEVCSHPGRQSDKLNLALWLAPYGTCKTTPDQAVEKIEEAG